MKPEFSNKSGDVPILSMAAFAMVWLAARAVLQSVTIDEADAYLAFVAPDWPSHWYPSNGNHILNSVLVRLLTWLFGLSHLTLRGPALLGGAVYIFAAYRLCKTIACGSKLYLPLFLCFVFNPFVMDYLVASRGYGLALGFFTFGFYILCREIVREPEGEDAQGIYRAGQLASVCLALSFNANFSFAYADATCMAVFILWTCWKKDWKVWARIGAACVVPGLLITAIISGSALWDWPKGQFVYGANSLRQTWTGVLTSSFYELNQELVNPLMRRLLGRARWWLPLVVISVAVLEVAVLAARRFKVRNLHEERLLLVGGFACGSLAITLSLHWLQFRLFKILLPLDRTALFIVPLGLVVFGALTALASRMRLGRIPGALAVGSLYLAAAYFMGSLRLLYFKEWRFDADVKSAYVAIRTLNREHGMRKFATDWKYVSTLTFYRRFYSDEQAIDAFEVVENGGAPGAGQGFVLYFPEAAGIMERNGLKEIYRGSLSDIVVAAP